MSSNLPATVTVTVAVRPLTVEVHTDDLDADTLALHGHEAAVREAAHDSALALMESGAFELENPTPTPAPTQTVRISYLATVRHTATIEVPCAPDADLWEATVEYMSEDPPQTETEDLGFEWDSLEVEPA